MMFPTIEKTIATANNHRLTRLDAIRKEQGDHDIHSVVKYTLVLPKKKVPYISQAVSWVNPKHHQSMVWAGADMSLTLIMVYDTMSGGYDVTKRMRAFLSAYEKAVDAYIKKQKEKPASKTKLVKERMPGPTRAPKRTMDTQ